jgi:hypothetical protein
VPPTSTGSGADAAGVVSGALTMNPPISDSEKGVASFALRVHGISSGSVPRLRRMKESSGARNFPPSVSTGCRIADSFRSSSGDSMVKDAGTANAP